MRWEKVDGGGAVGRMKRHARPGQVVMRILELDPRWEEEEWCRKKHVGYVLSGALSLEVEQGPQFSVKKGQGFFVPDGCPHRATCKKVTRVFLVE
jgi:quercetin dioxygenase-like cupin family protein